MRIAGFLTGMVVSTTAVVGLALWAGLSFWSVVGLGVTTLVLSQVLYLGLILLMVKEESDSRRPSAQQPLASTDNLMRIHKPRHPHV